MKPKILEEHNDELIVRMNGKITSIPNNAYTKLRKIYFDDNRILYPFADFVSANETYNDRIFNLVFDKYLLTVRQDKANDVAECILDHFKKGDYTKFKELFLKLYSDEHQDELVEKFILSLSTAIKIEKDFRLDNGNTAPKPIYSIDDKFAIDGKGTSYYKREKDNSWNFLCTVVTSQNQSYRVKMGELGWAKLTSNTSGIISKIVFFLNPNAKDTVFTNQLQQTSPKLYESIQDGTYLKQKV